MLEKYKLLKNTANKLERGDNFRKQTLKFSKQEEKKKNKKQYNYSCLSTRALASGQGFDCTAVPGKSDAKKVNKQLNVMLCLK